MRESIDREVLNEFIEQAIKQGQAFDHSEFIHREVQRRLEIGEQEYGANQFKTAERIREAREEGVDLALWTFFEFMLRMADPTDSPEFSEAMGLLALAAACGARAVDCLMRYSELARESLPPLQTEAVGSP